MSAPWRLHRDTQSRPDLILILLGVLQAALWTLPAESNASDGGQAHEFTNHLVLLPGERILIGTVVSHLKFGQV